MKEFFKDVIIDKTIRFGFLISLIAIVSALFFVFFSYQNLPSALPIFNQLPWGERRLGSTMQIFIPIAIAFCVFLLNLTLSPFFYKKIPLISRMLAIVSLISSILVFIFLVKTIQSVL